MADGASGAMTVLAQAARSMVLVDGGWPRLCQPSTLRMVIWPEASNAQNSMAAVSAEGSTVCVLMRRLNSSCSRSTAFVTGMRIAVPVSSGWGGVDAPAYGATVNVWSRLEGLTLGATDPVSSG